MKSLDLSWTKPALEGIKYLVIVIQIQVQMNNQKNVHKMPNIKDSKKPLKHCHETLISF